jgi:type IV secretion system protein VirB6
MIDSCILASGPPSLARDILASTDCFLGTKVEQAYGLLLAPGGNFGNMLTIGLTIYVAIYGYQLILGQASLALSSVVPHFLKIGVIVAMVTNWPTYQVLVFDLLFHGPQEVASLIMAKTGGSSVSNQGDALAALQVLFDHITGFAGDYWAQHAPAAKQAVASTLPAAPVAPATEAAPFMPEVVRGAANVPQQANAAAAAPALPFALGAPQFVAMALWVSSLLMMATSVGVLLIVRIILAILLIFGPLFVAMALFSTTRSIAEGWLRVTVKFALVPLLVLPLTAILISVLVPFASELQDGPIESFRDGPTLAILMVVMVFAAVLLQAIDLAGTIAGGIKLPRRPPTAPAAPETVQRDVIMPASAPQASRADLIAGMVPATGSGSRNIIASQRTEALGAGRMIDAPQANVTVSADMAGRLGQSYRRNPPRTGFVADMRNPVS